MRSPTTNLERCAVRVYKAWQNKRLYFEARNGHSGYLEAQEYLSLLCAALGGDMWKH